MLRRYCLWIVGNAATLEKDDEMWRKLIHSARVSRRFWIAKHDSQGRRHIQNTSTKVVYEGNTHNRGAGTQNAKGVATVKNARGETSNARCDSRTVTRNVQNARRQTRSVKCDSQNVRGDNEHVRGDALNVRRGTHDVGSNHFQRVTDATEHVLDDTLKILRDLNVHNVSGGIQNVKSDPKNLRADTPSVRVVTQDMTGISQNMRGVVQTTKGDIQNVRADVQHVRGNIECGSGQTGSGKVPNLNTGSENTRTLLGETPRVTDWNEIMKSDTHSTNYNAHNGDDNPSLRPGLLSLCGSAGVIWILGRAITALFRRP